LIALRLSLGPMIALGLARFAYAIVLPAMRDSLGLSFTETGALGTANAAGYLAGTLLTATAVRHLGAKRAFDISALATATSVVLTGVWASYEWLLLTRFLAGACGAMTFVIGSTLAARLAVEARQSPGLIVSTYVSGVGLGLIISGLLAPPLLQPELFAGVLAGVRWRLVWIVMGAVGCVLLGLARNRWTPVDTPGAVAGNSVNWRTIWPTLIAYGLFGLGYITYMTFIVAFVQNRLPSFAWVMAMWCALGVMIVLSPRIWQRVLDGAPRGLAFAAVVTVLVIAVLLPLLNVSITTVFISACLFGSFLMVPSAVTLYVRRALPQPQWVGGMALATTAFAIGQTLGPVVSGAIADASGSLFAGLTLSAGALALAALMALLQREQAAVDAVQPTRVTPG
jgi:predicted MFS family arabinose efflux permease